MAISDMKGTVTTTGMMNQQTKMPKGKVDPKMPQPVADKPNTQPTPQPTPEQNLEQELLSKFPGLKDLTAGTAKDQYPCKNASPYLGIICDCVKDKSIR